MGAAGDSAARLGDELADTTGSADALARTANETGQRIRSSLQNAGEASDSLGASFAQNFTRSAQAGNSFSASIRSGIVGALDNAKKRVKTFASDSVSNIKKVGNAFLHPVQTIKSKFTNSVRNAASSVEDVGDEAQRSERDLDGMGSAGLSAGEKMSNGLQGALKVVAALAAAAVAITGIAKFTAAALNASQAAENISYSFDQAFGDNAPDVAGWAGNFADAVHRSESEVKSFLTSNKQLYKGMGVTGQAANDLSRMTTSLAYDIGNKFGVEDAEALSSLQDAIKGNNEALNSFGVTLNDAALKQSAMSMGIHGNLEELDEATLSQVRFNAILEQTSDLQGDAANSIGGMTGGVKALKSMWTDFLEKAGTRLMPTFEKIFSVILDAWPKVEPALMSLVDLLASGFSESAPIIEMFTEDLLPIVLGLLGDLAPILMEIGGQLLPVFAQVFGAVVEAVQPIMPLISKLIGTLLPPLAELFGNLVETLLPPLGELLGALEPILDALSPILEIVAGAIGLVADAIAVLIGWITKGIEKIRDFSGVFQDSKVGQFISGAGDFLGNAFGGGSSSMPGNASGTDNFEGGWTRVNEAGGEIIHARHGPGVAYLPQGSAVIPASKTDEILSDKPTGNVIQITNMLPSSGTGVVPRTGPRNGWEPEVVHGKPDGEDGTGTPPPSDSPPSDQSPPNQSSNGGMVLRRVLDINVNVTSSDNSVTRDLLDELEDRFRVVAREEARDAVREANDDELNSLAIQEGFVS